MAENRIREARSTSRSTQTREASTRKKQWAPANLLPEPTPQEGVKFRWIRKSMMGTTDPTNFSRKSREGWEPCRLDDHPELALDVDNEARASGLVEIGGLILCRIPEEIVGQRNEYYHRKASSAMEAVDNSLMRENDPRMPLFKDRKSQVSFGHGS